MGNIKIIKDIKQLKPEDGDLLVFTVDDTATQANVEYLAELIRNIFPDNSIKVIIAPEKIIKAVTIITAEQLEKVKANA